MPSLQPRDATGAGFNGSRSLRRAFVGFKSGQVGAKRFGVCLLGDLFFGTLLKII